MEETLVTLPFSTQAEQSVLGAIMLDNATFDKISDTLTWQDFHHRNHRIIFKAFTELAKNDKPIDVVTMSEALKCRKELELAGGEVYLFELAKNTPNASNIVAYADIVKEKSIKTKIALTANKLLKDVIDAGKTADEALESAEKDIFDLGDNKQKPIKPTLLVDAVREALADIEIMSERNEAITGIASGFKDLDALTSGFQAADLVIIAGRPSMGKTALAMNIAENVAITAAKKSSVLIFSLEMPTKSITTRMLSSISCVDHHRLRTAQLSADDWGRLISAQAIMENGQIIIDDTPTLTPLEMRSRIRRTIREFGRIDLIIVDYLQFMHSPKKSENRVLEISDISRSLKAIAKEFNVPIIALSQLSRNVESRMDKRPVLSDLRDSGAIEQDADLVAFVYRDEMYNKESLDRGTAELIIAKHRNGPTGTIKLKFLKTMARFENFIPNARSFFSEESTNYA